MQGKEYLKTRAEEIVTAYAKRAGTTDGFKSEIAKFLLSLRPKDRVLLIDALNQEDRNDAEYAQRLQSERLAEVDYADGVSSTLKHEYSEAEG